MVGNRNYEAMVKFDPCLAELEQVWGGMRSESKLCYNQMYSVFCGSSPRATFASLYGPLVLIRGIRKKVRIRLESLLKNSNQRIVDVGFGVPVDAVLFAPPAADRLVVASHAAGRVLKLFRGECRNSGAMHSEIETLSWLGRKCLSEHAPILYEKGTTQNGSEWMVTGLAENRKPVNLLYSTRVFHRRWQRWMADQVVPYLVGLYRVSGCETVSAWQVFDRFQNAVRAQQAVDLSAFSEVEFSPGKFASQLTIAQVYGDVMATHVHRWSRTRWKLIDWGKTRRGPICRDLLADYFGDPAGGGWRQASFCSWLGGRTEFADLPSEVQFDLDLVRRMHLDLTGVEPGDTELKKLVRIAALFEATRLVEHGEHGYAMLMLASWLSAANVPR